MHISSLQNAGETLKVSAIDSAHPGWDYSIQIGTMISIYLSRSELVSLTNQSIRLIADAWADEADDVQS